MSNPIEQLAARQYRKKPVVIEAIQIPADYVTSHGRTSPEFWERDLPAFIEYGRLAGTPVLPMPDGIVIKTLENRDEGFFAAPGWWLIRGVKGEIYACAPDVFAATYESVARVSEAPREPPLRLERGELVALHAKHRDEAIRNNVIPEAAHEVGLFAVYLRGKAKGAEGLAVTEHIEVERGPVPAGDGAPRSKSELKRRIAQGDPSVNEQTVPLADRGDGAPEPLRLPAAWQSCPSCSGYGVVTFNPAAPTSTYSADAGPWECPTCRGQRILAVAAPSPYDDDVGAWDLGRAPEGPWRVAQDAGAVVQPRFVELRDASPARYGARWYSNGFPSPEEAQAVCDALNALERT